MHAQTEVFPCPAVAADGEKITIVSVATPVATTTGIARLSRQDTGDILNELEDGVFRQISTGKIFHRNVGDDPIQGGYL